MFFFLFTGNGSTVGHTERLALIFGTLIRSKWRHSSSKANGHTRKWIKSTPCFHVLRFHGIFSRHYWLDFGWHSSVFVAKIVGFFFPPRIESERMSVHAIGLAVSRCFVFPPCSFKSSNNNTNLRKKGEENTEKERERDGKRKRGRDEKNQKRKRYKRRYVHDAT